MPTLATQGRRSLAPHERADRVGLPCSQPLRGCLPLATHRSVFPLADPAGAAQLYDAAETLALKPSPAARLRPRGSGR